MSQPTQKSERLTAILSTLVAIAILAAGVTAQQSHHTPEDDLARLESDLRFQLERAFKHDGSQRTKRMAQVDQVLEAWQDSPQSNQDRQLLTSWITEATIQSMPGSSLSFPPAPEFGQPVPLPVSTTPSNSTPSSKKLLSVKPNVVTQVKKPVLTANPTTTPAPLATPIPAEVATLPITPGPIVASISPLIETTTPEHSIAPQVSPKQTAPTQTKLQTASLRTPSKDAATPVHINLVELTARIDGYHHSLDAVETRLLTLRSPNLDILAEQIQKLDQMTRDFHFVKLYYEALTDKQRRMTPAPRSMAATLAELNRHLDRYEEAQNEDFLSAFDTAQSEQLDTLRTQLATIGQRVAQ